MLKQPTENEIVAVEKALKKRFGNNEGVGSACFISHKRKVNLGLVLSETRVNMGKIFGIVYRFDERTQLLSLNHSNAELMRNGVWKIID